MVASEELLPKGGNMTRTSVQEYSEAVQRRYLQETKKEKGKILDEFTKVTGYHRKAAIRLLHQANRRPANKKRGRRRKYSPAVAGALKIAWEATDRLCSKRLHPFLPELMSILRRHGEASVPVELEVEMCQVSPATIDRLLKPWRRLGGRRPFSTTKPGSLLKSAIPIRTFADWEENRPGFIEADLVPHCGGSSEGFYLNSLSTVDVATGWSECRGVWGKGQERVGGAVHHIRGRLSFPLLGLDSDNGGEFINQHLFAYCQREGITFTRSRSYKKNDSCHVEQKNWSVVRRLIGYDRYNSREALEVLNRIYDLLRLYVNFFQPVMKLVRKTRHGAKVHKVYDAARTPYQRLLEFGVLTDTKQQALAATYHALNPVLLLKQINENLECLWKLAVVPAHQQKKAETQKVLVT